MSREWPPVQGSWCECSSPVPCVTSARKVAWKCAENVCALEARRAAASCRSVSVRAVYGIVFGDDQRYVQYFARLQLKTKQAKPMGRGEEGGWLISACPISETTARGAVPKVTPYQFASVFDHWIEHLRGFIWGS